MTDPVLVEQRGRAMFITLNRPEVLNALNREMCVQVHAALFRGLGEASVDRVVIEGAGDRAFCAGGDIVGLATSGRSSPDDWQGFFRDEYRLNQVVATFPDDYVAILDGATMGGGVGLSIHGRFRVATERTLFAMPETGIGLTPDVGSTHALARLPGEIGTWLALTGARLKAADCLYAGIATHVVPADRLALLRELLADGEEPVGQILDTLDTPAGEPALEALRDAIDFHFAHDRVEDIQASLAEGDDWARSQYDAIARMSPTSLKLALRSVRMGRNANIEAALTTEYRIVSQLRFGRDFYEGVRAQLIDRDRSPLWSPATLAEVTDEMIEAHLREPAGGDIDFH